MPTYEFKCQEARCKKTEDVLFKVNEEHVAPLCPKHQVPMRRVYSAPAILTGTSGQKQLLGKKQEQRKTRSRAHFKNEVLKTVTDKHSREHFKRKYANTKKVDHTKL